MIIQLIRTKQVGKAVYGSFALPFPEREPLVYPSIENADFIIPPGKYPLKMTWSPRFKKDMPLIDEVPDREGIRVHMGTKPEHSEGCVLTDYAGLANLRIFIDYVNAWFENEPLFIEIINQFES